MNNSENFIQFPELIFGVAGPIGIDIDQIAENLKLSLSYVNYESVLIKITDEMNAWSIEPIELNKSEKNDFHSQISYKMDYANALCKKYEDPATLIRIAINAIRKHRENIKNYRDANTNTNHSPEDKTVSKVAYIIRQLKRPEEVLLLRKIYGRQFILISAYGSVDHRKSIIETKLRRSLPLNEKSTDISGKADELIYRDTSEDENNFGQHLRETFHLADVFVDGISKNEMALKIDRFISALFGRTDIAPTKTEYGMYAAKSASLRSADLSRQVGAAIFSENGEIITQGCNEVPKAFGGTYWDTEDPDFRDVKIGNDPNEILKREVVRDLLERLQQGGMLSDKALSLGSSSNLVDALVKKSKSGEIFEEFGQLSTSFLMELTEYGRVVHAEMCAICDAARIGRSIKGATLYCTTFPCHNCTKHILAAGIRRVIYIEPYQKAEPKNFSKTKLN